MKKRYYNSTTHEWYNDENSLTRRVNGAVFSGIPTIEQLTEWGFEEWVEPAPTPAELLERAKQEKIAELEAYNVSDNVDSFTIGNQTMWLNVEERQQIATQISANEAVGRTSMTRWFNGHAFTFPLNTWKQMLVALEVYCGDALNITESHKAAIKTLTTVAEIEGYDYTTDYPEKLIF